MNLDALDRNLASFVRALFAKWPEWRAFAVLDGEGDAARFRLHVPDPPGSRLDSPLSVWADGEEITVGMDNWHTHFPWPCQPNVLDAEMTDPILFLQALIDERAAVLTYLQGGASILTLAEYKAGRFRERRYSGLDGYRVRSWRGTLDQDGRSNV